MPSARQLLLACSLLGLTARADLVVVQKVEGGGLEGDMTIRFKEKKVRADLALPISTIVDAESGETLVLQHRTKTFNRITVEQTRGLAEQMLKAQGSEQPKLNPSDEKKEVAGQQTQAFLWTVGKMKVRFWVATDYPNGEQIQKQLELMQNSALASVTANMMPTAQQLPGVRLRTELELGDQKVKTTITSIKQESVDPSIFQVPVGYKEVPLPVPGAGALGE